MSEFLQRFAERFAELNANNLERLAELYSDDILFRDPLHEVCGLAALQDYFAALYANVRELRFEFHGIEQCAEDAGYLRWTMRYRHPRLRGGAPIWPCHHLYHPGAQGCDPECFSCLRSARPHREQSYQSR